MPPDLFGMHDPDEFDFRRRVKVVGDDARDGGIDEFDSNLTVGVCNERGARELGDLIASRGNSNGGADAAARDDCGRFSDGLFAADAEMSDRVSNGQRADSVRRDFR